MLTMLASDAVKQFGEQLVGRVITTVKIVFQVFSSDHGPTPSFVSPPLYLKSKALRVCWVLQFKSTVTASTFSPIRC